LPSGVAPTNVEVIKVERGDAIDFMVDAINGNGASDSFSWTTLLTLTSDEPTPLTFDSARGFQGPARSNSDVIIAAACLTRDWLRAVGESILKTKLEHTYGPESLRLRPLLRYAHATALQSRYADATDLLADSDLALWLPSSTKRAWPNPQGGVSCMPLALATITCFSSIR
jgi:hypothetical protein